MTFVTEESVIRDRLRSGWTTTPVAWDNAPTFTPPNGSAWIRPTILPADGFAPEIGTGRDRHVGVLAIQVFVPKGTGEVTARTHAESLGSLFRHYRVSGMRFDVPVYRRLGEDDGWYGVLVEIPYTRDTTY